MNGRERILAMLEGRPVDQLPLMPITMMFAGDHAGVKYGEYARDYRVLAEAQVATARDFQFDYVSAISDPAREAADCGAEIEYFDDQPPAINEMNARLTDKSDLDQLEIPDPLSGGRMLDRVRGVALLKEKAGGDKLIEGWIEGPCAESADLRGINTLMLDFYDDPGFVRRMFDFVLEMGLRFAKAQIDAGAELMGVGDAAASLIGPQLYEEFVWPYEKKLVDGLHALGTKSAAAHLRQDVRRFWKASASWVARSSIWTFLFPSPTPAERWGRARCCWAISIPSAHSATAPPNRSRRPSPSAIGRPGLATSSAPVAKSRAARPKKTCSP